MNTRLFLKILSLGCLIPVLTPLDSLRAEDVNLSTYYPSPYGSYQRLRVEEVSDAIGTFTGGVTRAGLQIISDFSTGDFMPGIFWTTSDNNPAVPKAGIWMHEDTSGTELYFGTSSNSAPAAYSEGLNNYRSGSLTLADATPGMVLDQYGRLGLGRMDPFAQFQVESNSMVRLGHFSRYFSNFMSPSLTIHHARGTQNAPGYLIQGDGLGQFNFAGSRFNAGVWSSIETARIEGTATENWAVSNWSTQLSFWTTKGSSVSERMRVTDDGALELIGLSSDPGASTVASGTIPETARIYYNTGSNQILVSREGSTYSPLGGSAPILIAKTGGQLLFSTTFVDDSALQLPIGANETWQFEVAACVKEYSDTDIQFKLEGPALGATGWLGADAILLYDDPAVGGSSEQYYYYRFNSYSDYQSINRGTPDHYVHVSIKGMVKNGPTAGTFRVQWALRAPPGGNANVCRGSYLKATQVS